MDLQSGEFARSPDASGSAGDLDKLCLIKAASFKKV